MERLSVERRVHVALACAEAFDRFLSHDRAASDTELPMIGSRALWGARDMPGRQTITRHAMGVYDVEVLERIVTLERPLRYVSEMTPLRMLPYDPDERLPPVGEEPGNPERAFRSRFGADPVSTRYEVDCAPRAGGTDLAVAISVPARRFGWLARRTWSRRMGAALDRRLADFAARFALR